MSLPSFFNNSYIWLPFIYILMKSILYGLLCVCFLNSVASAQSVCPIAPPSLAVLMGPSCEGASLLIMSDSPPMDYVIEWSTDGNTPNLGTFSMGNYNAVITSFPTNYYARFTSVALNCTTSWSIPQFVVADPISQPTGISGGERCGNGNVTFTASIPSNPDEQIQWSLDGANIADIGTNYNVSVFSGNPKTIYVRVANTVTGCTTNFLSNPFIATADLCIDPFSSTTVAGFGTAGNVNGSGMGDRKSHV